MGETRAASHRPEDEGRSSWVGYMRAKRERLYLYAGFPKRSTDAKSRDDPRERDRGGRDRQGKAASYMRVPTG